MKELKCRCGIVPVFQPKAEEILAKCISSFGGVPQQLIVISGTGRNIASNGQSPNKPSCQPIALASSLYIQIISMLRIASNDAAAIVKRPKCGLCRGITKICGLPHLID